MKVVVYGLGIIGASICASLKKAGYTVYGKNRSKEPVAYALEHGFIDGEAKDYAGADAVFLALPPDITVRELDGGDFPAGCVVTDICGVKGAIEEKVYSRPRVYRYVGTHPMAGKETSGIRSAGAELFAGANFIVTKCAQTDEAAVVLIKKLALDMGFGQIIECSAKRHDEMIALTSQLAHIVSGAYVKSPHTSDCGGFTGGSFQDMTRVAGVDEEMWTQLYFFNRENLLAEIDRMLARLEEYRAALEVLDGDRMKELQREGKRYREEFFHINKA